MGRRARQRVHPGDDVGEVLLHRAGRCRRRAGEPDHGQARRARVPPARGYSVELLRRDRILRGGREERGMTTANSFGSRAQLKAAGRTFEIFRLDALERRGLAVPPLPYPLRILLENLRRPADVLTGAAPRTGQRSRVYTT